KAIAFAGIPGEVAAIAHISKNYARFSLVEDLKPAIRLARKGFAADQAFVLALEKFSSILQKSPQSGRIFFDKGQIPSPGYTIVQEDLADILEAIGYEGREGFYEGKTAEKLVEGVNQLGGNWLLEDLKKYQVKIRKPLKANFRDWTITTVPPPSAGGLTILTSLRVLDRFEEDPLSTSDRIHLIVESFRRAHCDRVRFVSDPDFYKTPDALTTDTHIEQLRDSIEFFKASNAKTFPCEPLSNHGNTTHFSIIDKEGNRVAATLSINDFFGTGLMVPGTGILLNNELADFSFADKKSPNRLESSKRPVSSMSPLFLESSDTLAILGTPGGLRIPSMLLLAILAAEEGQAPKQWLKNPRFHFNFTQNVIEYESGAFSQPVKNALQLRGHQLKEVEPYGNMQLVYLDKKNEILSAFSDPRWFGKAMVQTASSSDTLRVN
ncbi:MAG TPA: gamma-glutamyltransferase, partial [Gammaproteobacteria bacterium]|nr:gamma-glutamyltransferase [Gammaproteobacteria bacterium]